MDRFENKRPLKQYFGTFSVILAVLLGMVCLLAMILLQWNSLHQDDRILPASLLAVSTEDYSGGRPLRPAQVIGLAIIGDTMKDTGLQTSDLSGRLASVTAELLTLVPSATANLPHTVTPISTGTPSSKTSPHPTLAQTQLSPTSQLPSASNTPAASPIVPPITATSAPATSTAGPVAHPTNTSSPAPLPTSPSKPTPPTKPTPQPKHTPKPKKTKKPKHFSSQAGLGYMSTFSGSSLPASSIQRAGPVNAPSAAIISLKPLSTFFLQLAALLGSACHFL